MKLKTAQEIEGLIRDISGEALVCLVPLEGKSGTTSHEHTLCDCRVEKLIKDIAHRVQQDLLDSASEGFEEYFSEFEKRSTPVAIKNIVLEIWQAATIASEKRIQEQRTTSLHRENQKLQEEINFLKAMNGRLEEARVAHLEDNEKLQEENKKLREDLNWATKELSNPTGWRNSEHQSKEIRTRHGLDKEAL